MSAPHELVLLSPYRYPAHSALTLANEDMAAWLNGFTALWHPALLWQAKGPPRCDAPYDHEQPKPGFVYALPESPPSYLPEDWEQRVREAGAVFFRATTDRETTLANLRAALHAEEAPALGWKDGLDQAAEAAGAFYGLGFGHLLLATLSEAMEHENLLDPAAFWDDVQYGVALLNGQPYTPASAIVAGRPTPGYADEYAPQPPEGDYYAGPPEGEGQAAPPEPVDVSSAIAEGPPPEETGLQCDWRAPLQAAASRLLSAREVLYPVTIHLLNLYLLDEDHLDVPWSEPVESGVPVNLLAATATLERLAETHPDQMDLLRSAVANGQAEVCGGSYREREDPLLPLDSQLWNLRHGLDRAKELLGTDVHVYARKRFGFSPQTPLLLTTNGVSKALFLTFDEASAVPNFTQCVVSWSSPDGKQVDALTRAPKPADSPETFFNLGHFWFKTTREDHSATLFFRHGPNPTAPWFHDLVELAQLAPVLGTWMTFSTYFAQVYAGEYPPTPTADDFHYDFLGERVDAKLPDPVSGFPRHLKLRRHLDACWTFAALHRSLAGTKDTLDIEDRLRQIEAKLESSVGPVAVLGDLEEAERMTTAALAARLQSRAQENQPGWMVLNPCGFARRAALEFDGATRPLPIGGPVKACQLDGGRLRAVVEVPALGFVWLPREGPPGTAPMPAKLRMADPSSNTLRNDFFEVEVDPVTGGLKAIRDHKTRINRIGQQLIFNPGSRMVVKELKVTSSGPAMGEIVATGVLIGEQDQVLANFVQRYRAWMGRPLLEMRIELEPLQPPAGYAWHAYYGARFAWRDERASVFRSIAGSSFLSNHPRPQSPDFVEVRTHPLSTAILTGGLPFHRREGLRMLDVILVPEGEKSVAFDLGIVLDREQPIQTALGYASPIAAVPTTKGPPHIGASGWLFHIDASNLLLTRLTPGVFEANPPEVEPPPGPRDAITARFVECANYSGFAEFRCVRDPKRATVLGGRGQFLVQSHISGDAVHLEVSPNDLVHVQVEFS